MTVHVRYPGRICLLGEHCDWAGGASLTVPMHLGVALTAEPGTHGLGVRSVFEGELVEGRWTLAQLRAWAQEAPPRWPGGVLRFVPAAACLLLRRGLPLGELELLARSDLPAGRGFSSSAAFCLAALDAMARAVGVELSAEELAEAAYEVEHDLVGVACGRLDQHACAAGQALFFRWQGGLPTTRPVAAKVVLPLVVAAFPTPRDTPAILAALGGHHARTVREPDPDGATAGVREALQVWASAAEAGAHAMEAGSLQELGAAMERCQEVYERALAARLPELKAPGLVRTCAALRSWGAMGAKFSGAGGDGSVVALFPTAEAAEEAASKLRGRGLHAWSLLVAPS